MSVSHLISVHAARELSIRALNCRRKPPSRKIFCTPKNRRKIDGLAEKPLTIILRLAAEKLYHFNITIVTKGTNRDNHLAL